MGGQINPDKNRIVAVVTGANGGLGFAICNVLLQCLSQHPDDAVYETTPMSSAIHPTLQHLLPDASAQVASSSNKVQGETSNPSLTPLNTELPSLNLVLVCRNRTKGENAKRQLLEEHEQLLLSRARKGLKVREDWRDRLQITLETCDLSTPGGDQGLLALCGRLRRTLPHITLLFLNAAHAQLLGNDYPALTKQLLTEGPIEAFTRPKFMREAPGVMSKDGERGMVWTTNVLSTYILTRELAPVLQKSPDSLPFEPRVIHTSSRTAEFGALASDVSTDPQMKHAPRTYAASKYLATLLIAHFDRELGSPRSSRPVRCVNVDPGAVRTNVMDEGFSAEGAGLAIYVAIMRWGYWLAFMMCKYVLGSTWHPGSPDNASLAMVYASLLDSGYIADPEVSPGPVFQIWARRWQRPAVALRDVHQLSRTKEVLQSQVEECERVWKTWREREGLSVDIDTR